MVTFKDGSKYDGDWKKGKRHGQGTKFFADGKVDRQGAWEKSEFKG